MRTDGIHRLFGTTFKLIPYLSSTYKILFHSLRYLFAALKSRAYDICHKGWQMSFPTMVLLCSSLKEEARELFDHFPPLFFRFFSPSLFCSLAAASGKEERQRERRRNLTTLPLEEALSLSNRVEKRERGRKRERSARKGSKRERKVFRRWPPPPPNQSPREGGES